MERFVIPRRDDDLLRPATDAYYVEQVIEDEAEIRDALEAFHLSVEQEEYSRVEDLFDAFFSLVRQSSDHYRHDFNVELRADAFNLLATGLENLLQPLKSHLEEVVNSPLLAPELIADSEKLANYLMMYVYLLSRLTNHLEGYVDKSSRLAQQGMASPARRGRKAQPAAFTQDEVVQLWLGTDGGRERILRLLHCLVRLKVVNVETGAKVHAAIRYLWVPDVVDKQLLGCIIDTLVRLLENPDTARASGRPVLNAVFAIIRDLCVRLGETEAVCDALMGLAFRLEVLHQPACTNFHFIDAILGAEKKLRKGELHPLLAQMVAYAGSVDVQAFRTRGEFGARVLNLFITTLAERRPQLLYTHLAYIVPFLSFDPSSLRSAVLTAFCDILIDGEHADEGGARVEGRHVDAEREIMQGHLQEHITDVNSYVRARALNLWIKLVKSRSIPLDQQGFSLVIDATGRLNDTSVMVRKAAANLLQTLLTFNPFGSDLSFRPAVNEANRTESRHKQLLQSKERLTELMANGGRGFVQQSSKSKHQFDAQLPSTSTANVDSDTDALMEEDRQETLDREIEEAKALADRAMLRLCFIKELGTAQSTAVVSLRRTSEVGELQELIRFISECRKFRLRGAQRAMNSVFTMIWRKDSAINEIVIHAADSLFVENMNGEALAKRSVDNLMDVTLKASAEERLSLEESLVRAVEKKRRLPIQMLDLLREIIVDDTAETVKKLAAVRLMGVFGRAWPGMLRHQFGPISQLFMSSGCDEVRTELLRCCVAQLARPVKQRPFRLPPSDAFITALTKTLVDRVTEASVEGWMSHCHEAVPLLFGITARPYIVISSVYTQLAEAVQRASDDYRSGSFSISSPEMVRAESVQSTDVFAEMNGGPLNGDGGEPMSEDGRTSPMEGPPPDDRMRVLKARWELTASRLLFFAGELATGFIVYLEDSFSAAMRDSLQKIHDLRQGADDEGEGAALENLVAFDPAEDTPLSQFEKDSIRQKGFFEKADREDDRIGLTAVSEEEKLQMKTQNLLDKEAFETQTIFGRVLPLIMRFIHIDVGDELEEQAVTSLAKMMLINASCCKKLLPTLLDYYRRASPRARNNLLVVMTDLWFRFPNCFNPYIDEFIEKLKDTDAGVRRTCLLVLSHMILNDILKSTGKVADLAECLYDADENVAQMAKALFTDMGKKHNLLYNALPDVLERLVNESELPGRKLDELVQFLAGSVTKDQQRMRLVERLKEKLDADQFRRVQPHFKVSSQLQQQEQAMDTLDEEE